MQVQVKQKFILNFKGKMYQYDTGLQDMLEDHFNHGYTKFFVEEVTELQEDLAKVKTTRKSK